MRQAQVEDWLEDLIEFGPTAVADACREWRRTPINRRPVPGEIRKLCIEAMPRQQEHGQHAAPDDMDEYARSVGFASNAERLAAIRRDERDREPRYERARQAREQAGVPRPLAHTAATLGVKAREVSPEKYRADQIAVGIERPQTEVAE